MKDAADAESQIYYTPFLYPFLSPRFAFHPHIQTFFRKSTSLSSSSSIIIIIHSVWRKNMSSSSGQSSAYDLSFKILLIGDSAVGKSSLLVSFISNSVHDIGPTIGNSSVLVQSVVLNYWFCLLLWLYHIIMYKFTILLFSFYREFYNWCFKLLLSDLSFIVVIFCCSIWCNPFCCSYLVLFYVM